MAENWFQSSGFQSILESFYVVAKKCFFSTDNEKSEDTGGPSTETPAGQQDDAGTSNNENTADIPPTTNPLADLVR